jgi:hypothetical protein
MLRFSYNKGEMQCGKYIKAKNLQALLNQIMLMPLSIGKIKKISS